MKSCQNMLSCTIFLCLTQELRDDWAACVSVAPSPLQAQTVKLWLFNGTFQWANPSKPSSNPSATSAFSQTGVAIAPESRKWAHRKLRSLPKSVMELTRPDLTSVSCLSAITVALWRLVFLNPHNKGVWVSSSIPLSASLSFMFGSSTFKFRHLPRPLGTTRLVWYCQPLEKLLCLCLTRAEWCKYEMSRPE